MPLHRFSHSAMATAFEILVVSEDRRYAEQAMQEAFDELDRLEQEMSRFIESSDVSRINSLSPGERVRVGIATFECLKLAAQVSLETNGAFDVTASLRRPVPKAAEPQRHRSGSLQTPDPPDSGESGYEKISAPRGEVITLDSNAAEPLTNLGGQASRLPIGSETSASGGFPGNIAAQREDMAPLDSIDGGHEATNAVAPPSPGHRLLVLDEASHAIGVLADGVRVDLGGIGKGYALDHLAGLLRDWSLVPALLHSGQSTALALGAPPESEGWPVAIRDPHDPSLSLGSVRLRDAALSGSGQTLHGKHIIDPRTGLPAEGKVGAWALAPSAALADALSTAFMVMSPEEVESHCQEHEKTAGMVLLAGGQELLRFGDWLVHLGGNAGPHFRQGELRKAPT